jgi:hypothetical protein
MDGDGQAQGQDQQAGGVTFTASDGGDGGQQGQGNAQATDFFSFVPEELKGAPWLEKYKTPEDFFKGVDNLQKVAGQKMDGVVRPAADAKPEAWDEFYSKIGVPEKPDGYALTVDAKFKDLFLPGDDKMVAQIFHAAKLTPEQGAALLPKYLEMRAGQMEQLKAQRAEEFNAGKQALQKEWGSKFDENLGNAAKGLDKAGLLEDLEKQGLGNNPAILKLGELLNRALGEDYQREGQSFSQKAGMEAMKREMDGLTSNPNFQRDQGLQQRAFDLSAKILKASSRGQQAGSVPEFSAR